jgi:hypothetical protein
MCEQFCARAGAYQAAVDMQTASAKTASENGGRSGVAGLGAHNICASRV